MTRRFRCFRQIHLCPAVFLLVIACSRITAAQDVPVVRNIEPPNWWTPHSINPVRLLIHGQNLKGARVASTVAALQVSRPWTNDAGTCLFVDLLVEPGTSPGSYPLKIIVGGKELSASFELLKPLTPEVRFQGLSPDDVIYLIMPDRFSDGDPLNDDPAVSKGLWNRQKPRYYHGGDLQGIINHLPYLKDLGVTALWLTPVYDNANRLNESMIGDKEAGTDYHGYGAVDFYAVEEHLGDMSRLRALVDAAHSIGIKVIQDQVANHTGPYHPWVKDPPTPTWYHGTAANHLNESWQTWTLADPHATSETQRTTLDGWFAGILPDLNQDDDEASRYLIQNSLWWIGMTGFDAVRQDTLPYVPRRFWRDWASAIKKEYPHVTVVGEVFEADPSLVSFFQGGQARFDGIDSGINGLFDFPLFYAIRRAFAEGKPLREVAMAIARDHLYEQPNMLVTFLGLHDVRRFMNLEGATTAGIKLAFTFLMTARGIPLIYYGDELGMRGGDDPDNRRDFPGGWSDDSRNAFTPAGRTREEEEIFAHLRRLTHLRAELQPLRRGSMQSLFAGEQTWAYARTAGTECVIVVLNNSDRPESISVPLRSAGLADGTILRDRLGNSAEVVVQSGNVALKLPPRSASLFTARHPTT